MSDPKIAVTLVKTDLGNLLDESWQNKADKMVSDAEFAIKAYPVLVRYINLLKKGGNSNEKQVASEILDYIDGVMDQ